MQDDNNKLLDFDYDQSEMKPIIKVVGVGGGGGNAVETMFAGGSVKDVTFLLCNTDMQALRKSKVPNQLVLGPDITRGLGAATAPNEHRKRPNRAEKKSRKP